MTTKELTTRQREVLTMIEAKKSTGEIASALGITTQGVHGHMRRLRQRGLIPEASPRRTAVRKSVSIEDTFAPLRDVIDRQRQALERQDERIVEQILAAEKEVQALGEERKLIVEALERLGDLETSVRAGAAEPNGSEPYGAPDPADF